MSRVQANAKVTEFLRQQIDDKMTGQACLINLKNFFRTLDYDSLRAIHKHEWSKNKTEITVFADDTTLI